jgi:hypothetical protein
MIHERLSPEEASIFGLAELGTTALGPWSAARLYQRPRGRRLASRVIEITRHISDGCTETVQARLCAYYAQLPARPPALLLAQFGVNRCTILCPRRNDGTPVSIETQRLSAESLNETKSSSK